MRPPALGVQVILGPHVDVEAVATAAQGLRREVREFDVGAVVPAASEELPPGTRVGAVKLGELIVTAARSALSTTIVEVVWASRAGQRERGIALQIDGDVLAQSGQSSGEQSLLADQWLARHTDG